MYFSITISTEIIFDLINIYIFDWKINRIFSSQLLLIKYVGAFVSFSIAVILGTICKVIYLKIKRNIQNISWLTALKFHYLKKLTTW